MTENKGPETTEQVVDQLVYRNVIGHLMSGVTVLTTNVDGELFGTTASSVTSLSMEPPMVLICLNRTSATHDAIVKSGKFGVNILAEDQDGVGRHFARKGDDKFAEADYYLDDHLQIPLLEGSLATVVCRVTDTAVGGTHTVFLGTVADAEASGEAPLAYYRGAFGQFNDLQEDTAYDALRAYVLNRKTPVGETINIEQLAESLRLSPDAIENALIKLASDALVTRADDRGFAVAPLTTEITDYLIETRGSIEHEVVRSHLGKLTLDDAEALQEFVTELEQIREREGASLEEFMSTVGKFHERVVGLAGSRKLAGAYRRLGASSVWARGFDEGEWTDHFETKHLRALVDAASRGDVEAATAAVEAHTQSVKSVAHHVLNRNGGSL